MAACNQTNEPLTPLTKMLFDNLTKNMHDTVDWPMPMCEPLRKINYEVEVIDEGNIKIDGVLYEAEVESNWVNLKEVGVPGALYLGREVTMPIFSWEQMMELYNQGQTTFSIEANG